ncbi:MAG: GTP cyclohydrolase II [Rhodobacteraceae bacterium]|uniref:GTP cyclohydrolase II n=1 Tax=Thioclava sp. L04-15 TaxID=1915318 RepID=UPI0009989C2E|nr:MULTISPECIES: GTP cyclohydrolase II [unclassified Thioclava]MBD3804328.1 GTP cyclohydrolase II [Thioclava sp.]OOY29420.1 GTP cyclohydrolase II [Thioclava sp. L04-15]TNE82788.1 MAG: GTP cyclohydrolase II [Paracoccaceae bacterium]TNF13934.1 MAG: GTP cyclohydrolase II [Paracoccaceae bacterium]
MSGKFTLGPSPTERLNRARADLRMGVPVLLSGRLAVAVETLSPERLEALRALGPLVLAITARRASTLKARVYDEDVARIKVPAEADLRWLRALADPADDLRVPMKGPLEALRGGDADLARAAIRLAKSAQLLPAALLVEAPEPAPSDLTCVSAEEALTASDIPQAFAPVSAARVPMRAAEAGRLHIFRPDDGAEEHYAIEIGQPDRSKPVLARLHSACFTGDVLGSLKCDCGPQLDAALTMMGHEGTGVLLYLNQEGRGIGLANKMRAYSLQDQGFDTVEANHRLGFEDDERDFRIGAALLKKLGFSRVRLLTNNPAKVKMLEANGIEVVERVPLKVGMSRHNAAYLATKAAKSGHIL